MKLNFFFLIIFFISLSTGFAQDVKFDGKGNLIFEPVLVKGLSLNSEGLLSAAKSYFLESNGYEVNSTQTRVTAISNYLIKEDLILGLTYYVRIIYTVDVKDNRTRISAKSVGVFYTDSDDNWYEGVKTVKQHYKAKGKAKRIKRHAKTIDATIEELVNELKSQKDW